MKLPRGGEQLFDFTLSGSTHGLRLTNNLRFKKFTGEGGMKLIVDRVLPVDNCDVFYKPFYRRDDFDDERYKPVFSPTVYSGQTLKVRLEPHYYIPGRLYARPYVITAVRRERFDGQMVWLEEGREAEVEFRIPDTCGDCIAEVGFHVEVAAGTTSRCFAVVDLKEMTITGKPRYHVSTSLCREEFLQQTPFALNHGDWHTDGGSLICRGEEPAQAYTGNYYATDVTVTSDVTAAAGSCLMARAAGARRYLAAGFLGEGKLGLRIHDTGKTKEYTADYPWQQGKTYHLSLEVKGDTARLQVDEETALLEEKLPLAPYGMVGFAQETAGTGTFRDLRVKESGGYPDLIPQ